MPCLYLLYNTKPSTMDKYKNKYRISSARHQNWDYSWAGAYFITICTEDKEHYFGKIKNDKMQLSQIGVLADAFWHEIKNHAQNIKLDAFIVMPNHIHGILILNRNNTNETKTDTDADADVEKRHAFSKIPDQNLPDVEKRHAFSKIPDRKLPDVEKRHAFSPPESKPNTKTIGQKRFQNIGKNTISSIIGGYKSAVTKHSRRIGFKFGWQPSFHDHIIRNQPSFDNIAEYIHNNPRKWKEDKFYS